MTTSDISEDVRALLREHLTSFERLEIVLLLRAYPGQDWDVAAVSERTRIPPELVLEALQGLEASGLIRAATRDPMPVRYGPTSVGLAEVMGGLEKAYHEQRAIVMSLMSVNAIERIRSGSMRAFADSFMSGRKKRDG